MKRNHGPRFTLFVSVVARALLAPGLHTVASLARACDVSPRTVYRALAQLDSDGRLVVSRGWRSPSTFALKGRTYHVTEAA